MVRRRFNNYYKVEFDSKKKKEKKKNEEISWLMGMIGFNNFHHDCTVYTNCTHSWLAFVRNALHTAPSWFHFAIVVFVVLLAIIVQILPAEFVCSNVRDNSTLVNFYEKQCKNAWKLRSNPNESDSNQLTAIQFGALRFQGTSFR